MFTECEVIEQSPQPVLSIRTRTVVQNLPQLIGEAYGKIAQYLYELGAQPAGEPFVGYFNLDMQDLDVEIGFPVAAELPGKGEIQSSEFPGGKHAQCVYTGPYQEMAPAYDAMNAWLQEHHYEVTGVSYEFYLNSPQEVPLEQLQTKIMFPLK